MRVLPVLSVVLLSAPAWLTFPFLPSERRRAVLDLVKELIRWTHNHKQ